MSIISKFTKIHTVDGTVVLVPQDFYDKTLRSIRASFAGISKTRMYLYFLDSDGVMWRHPYKQELFAAKASGSLERVVSQFSFLPEAYIV